MKAALEELFALHPRLRSRILDDTGQVRRFVNVYIDDDESRTLQGIESRIAQGAVIRVLASVAGG